MATKDRTALKNDFANGKYATGEKFADLIDSMKVVQLPVVDPQALGTSLSFIDRISQDADGKITATKKTLDLSNAHELNPFKGWYETGDTLPTDGFDGAYLYFKDTSELTGQTTIYRWNGTTYADTGTVVDTSNVQTFGSGQSVNAVKIDDTKLANPSGNALAKAGDMIPLVAKLDGITRKETKVTLEANVNYYDGYLVDNTGTVKTDTSAPDGVSNGLLIVSVEGVKKVRFLGFEAKNSTKDGYGFSSQNSIDITSSSVQMNVPYGYIANGTVKKAVPIELDVPEDAKWFVATIRKYGTPETAVMTIDDFYCYLATGDSVVDKVDSAISYKREDLDLSSYAERTVIIYSDPNVGNLQYWGSSLAFGKSKFIPVTSGEVYLVEKGDNNTQIAFLTSDEYQSGVVVTTFADGICKISLNGDFPKIETVVPASANYMYVRTVNGSGNDCTPIIKKIVPVDNAENISKVTAISEKLTYDVDVMQTFLTNKVEGIVLSDNLWDDSGTSYIVEIGDDDDAEPLQIGDEIYIECGEYNVYVWFIEELPVVGEPLVRAVPDRFVVTPTSTNTRFIIPEGTVYVLMMGKTASNYDHTPIGIKKVVPYPRMSDTFFRNRTFNSSFNFVDVSQKRKAFCKLLNEKNTIETYLFFTDPHLTDYNRYGDGTPIVKDGTTYFQVGDNERNTYISTLQKYYNSLPIDHCICGGDWLNFYHTTDEACDFLGYIDAMMRKLFKSYIPINGNHDPNPYPNGPGYNYLHLSLTNETMKCLEFRENRDLYYAYDGINTKFYILDSGVSSVKTMTYAATPRLAENRWPQIAWLANKLLTDDAAHAIIGIHVYSNASTPDDWFTDGGTGLGAHGIHDLAKNAKDLLMAYNSRGTITLNGQTYDFGSCTGNVACIITGHTHFDYVDLSVSIPIISTTSLQGGYLDADGAYNSKSYSHIPTFDLCLADYDNDAIFCVRVGTGVDRIVNYTPIEVAAGSTVTLTTRLSGTVEWDTRDNAIASVSGGVVTGVTTGYCGIIASNGTEEEYWIVKVS